MLQLAVHARAGGAHEGVELEDDVLVAAAAAVEAVAVFRLPLVIFEDLAIPAQVQAQVGTARVGWRWCLLDGGGAEVRDGQAELGARVKLR